MSVLSGEVLYPKNYLFPLTLAYGYYTEPNLFLMFALQYIFLKCVWPNKKKT